VSRTFVALGAIAAIAVVLLLAVGGWIASTYNGLVRLDQAVEAQWAQVENVYQRRADLVPNLVETVKGAAEFERETFTAVTEARAKVGQISAEAAEDLTRDPEAFRRWQEAQGQLGGALSRLLVVSENYPQLRATEAFRDLQAQLEGTENRISVERMRFNDTAREYNTTLQSFPTNVVAGVFGGRFDERPYFAAEAGAEEAPAVKF
jgi:LemA protein